MYDHFLVDRSNRIATLTLNRPEKRNPINEGMLEEFEAIVAGLRDDRETRVVIVSGSGNSFCAGADLGIVAGVTDPEERRQIFAEARSRRIRLIARTFRMLENLEQATIAAVNGYAVGGGWGLALACDFHFAASGATYWFPEVDLGVPLSMGSSARLFAAVGAVRAKQIIITCDRYTAADLEAWGAINRVVPEAELLPTARVFAERLLEKAPRAVTGAKFTVNALAEVSAHELGTFDSDTFIHRS